MQICNGHFEAGLVKECSVLQVVVVDTSSSLSSNNSSSTICIVRTFKSTTTTGLKFFVHCMSRGSLDVHGSSSVNHWQRSRSSHIDEFLVRRLFRKGGSLNNGKVTGGVFVSVAKRNGHKFETNHFFCYDFFRNWHNGKRLARLHSTHELEKHDYANGARFSSLE